MIAGLLVFIFLLYKPFGLIRLPLFKVRAFEAIPANTALMLQGPMSRFQAAQTLGKTSFDALITEDALYQQFSKDWALIKRILSESEGSDPLIFSQAKLLIALQLNGVDDLGFLYVLDDAPKHFDLGQLLATKGGSRSMYKGTELYTLTMDQQQTFVLSRFRNLIIMGRLALQVEEAIEQLKQPHRNLLSDWGVKKMLRRKSDRVINCYVNFKNLALLLSPLFGQKDRPLLSALPKIGSWLHLGWEVEESCLKTKGQLLPHSDNTWLAANHQLEPQASGNLAAFLPDHTGLALRCAIGDPAQFFQNTTSAPQTDFHKYFAPWLADEMAYVITEPYSSDFDDEQFVYLKINDETKAQHYLEKYAQLSGHLEDIPYHNRSIHRLMHQDIFLPAFGPSLNNLHQPYYTLLGEYAVFCNSRQALEICLDKFLVSQTLANSDAYLQSQLALSDQASLSLYINIRHLRSLLRAYFQPSLRPTLDRALAHYSKVGGGQWQLKAEGIHYTIEGCLPVQPTAPERTEVMWKMALQAPASIAPALLQNPKNREYEIFVQDEQHRIYLMNRGGDILWSRRLDAKVLSNIYQIDYYNNGELQLLFNTSRGIYLMDRDGRDLSAYPIRLQSLASNGLLMVDFGGRKEYAFFVACENANLYGFERTGRPLNGWNPKRKVGRIHHPMRHFEEAGKDYLLALTEAGRLHVFSRDGRRRFDPQSFDAAFLSPFDFQHHSASTRIVATDQSGRARVLNTSGQSFDVHLDVGRNEEVRFAYADIAADERKEYIVLSDRELVAYAYQGNQLKKLYQHRFEYSQEQLFEVNQPSNGKQWIGTLNAQRQQIHLLDNQGQLLPDFPLAGTTSFQVAPLFGDDKPILVVGKGEEVYAYRLRP